MIEIYIDIELDETTSFGDIRTGAVGDVGGGVALGGEGEGKGGIDLEAKGWIISIFDKQADALRALLQHLFEASAAVNGWGL